MYQHPIGFGLQKNIYIGIYPKVDAIARLLGFLTLDKVQVKMDLCLACYLAVSIR